VHAPTVSFYRILPGKSTDEGRQVLGGYRGVVVVDGFAVYEVLARDGLGLVRTRNGNTRTSPINGRSHVRKSARSLVSST
jgi:hypothetical protein